MNKVVILQGLIAAGKSTYARELVEKGYKRVNKDDIRAMVDNGKYSRDNERLVNDIRDMIIDLSLVHGHDVVVDDTNFAKFHINQIKLIADINGAEVEVEKIEAPLEECIARDAKRKKPIGEEVIRKMYNKYLNEE